MKNTKDIPIPKNMSINDRAILYCNILSLENLSSLEEILNNLNDEELEKLENIQKRIKETCGLDIPLNKIIDEYLSSDFSKFISFKQILSLMILRG